MARKPVTIGLVIALLSIPLATNAAPYGKPYFYTFSSRYTEGETITFKLRHDQHTKVMRMGETWDVVDAEGSVLAQYYWEDDQRWLPPHQYRLWEWDQHQACSGACQNVWEGELVPPGRYRIVTTVDDQEVAKWFSVGAFFHLGFDGRPATDFVVFSNNADVVGQLRAELDRSQEERQIVAGIVRTRKPGYNTDWSFVLDPPSIFLGEVFVEVCDGAPRYIERHRNEWRGQQWCPWSSYVAAEGL